MAKIENLIRETICYGPHFDRYSMGVNHMHINDYICITKIVPPYLRRYWFCQPIAYVCVQQNFGWFMKRFPVKQMHIHSYWWSVQMSNMGWFARSRHISTMLEFCCWFGLELFCKRDAQHSSIWNRRLLYWHTWTFGECKCQVFCKMDVHPFIKTDDSRVPLFHYFAVNLYNVLSCLEDGISMSRNFPSYSMADQNLMAVILIETDHNSFCLSCKTLKFARWLPTPFCKTPSNMYYFSGGAINQCDSDVG